MIEASACRICGAMGTPSCMLCPSEFSRWRRATCRFAWRWRRTVAWSATGASVAVTFLVTVGH